jgi:anti-sigma-K factor RskA
MFGKNGAGEESVTEVCPSTSEISGFMNIAELQRKLLAAARKNPPSDHVPYAFEQRILARLATQPRFDRWALWGIALWRAALPCLVIMLLTATWIYVASDRSNSTTPLAIALEDTVFASLDNIGDSW